MSVNDFCDSEKNKLPIGKMKQKEEKIDPKIIAQQLTMISKDIISNEIVKYLNDNISHEIYACFEKTYAKKISQVIQTKGDFVTILENWKDQNDEKLTPILDKVFLCLLSKEESKFFLLETVIPYIMNADTNIEIRDLMIKAAFLLLKSVDISDLTLKEYDQFLQAVNNKYFTTIGQFRDLGYRNWHKLWIFLVRFFGKKIHSSMDLTNKLLRIVEYAFRNSDHMQRIRGYDCWKELIDNASLDMKCICSPKQIKLLITPLKAKFSKQEVVICKRFDVFTYLLEKLQEQSVLCLSEYLEFCFGPLGDNKDSSKSGQCKTIPVLWDKSTKVLIELLGHSHGKMECLTTDDVIKLNRPVITSHNFHTYYKQVIQSVAESSVLLKDSNSGLQYQKAIFCMWHSIFNFVIPASETSKPVYYKFLSGILENFLKEVTLNPYFDQLMVNILCTLLSFDKDFVYEAVQYFLPHILQTLLLTDLPIEDVDKLKMVLHHCFTKITLLEEKLCMMKDIMDCFTSSNKEINVNIGKIWICLAEELVSDLDVEMIEKFVNFEEFFIWPANYLHLLDDQTSKQILLPWVKLYRKISNDQDSKKLIFLDKLEALFKSNPLLSFSVISVLSVMAQFQTKYSKDFVLKLLKVTYSILQKPNLTVTEEYKACSIVLQYLDSSLEFYTSEKNPEIMKIVCDCIQSILCLHKDFKLLESFSGFVKTIPEDVKSVFSENLLKVLTDLQSNINKDKSTSNKYLTKELQKAVEALQCESQKDEKKIFVAPSGRSARIAQLAKKSPKSPKKQGTSPIALRLFGKDPETMAPLNVKGSQLNNSPNTKRKKGANVIELKPKPPSPLLEENSADFVVIDSEVKFEPEKLSEHQKEVLKRRRDDIPALYEDLSQSLSNSQDLFSAKFNANTNNTQKVIVESVHYFPPMPKSEETIKPTEKEELVRCDVITTYKSEDLFSSSSNIDSGLSKDYISQLKEDIVPTKQDNTTTDHKQLLLENICTKEDDSKSKSDDSSTSSSTTNKQEPTEDKRKKKIEKELQKLKMDVVGADNYVAVPRRTRPKEKKDKEEQETKPRGRKSMAANEKSSKDDQNRRKSIGVVDELKSKNEENNTEPNNAQDNDKIDVPKSERRSVGRPKKTRLDSVSEVDGAAKVESKSVNNNTVKGTPMPKRTKKVNQEIEDKAKKAKDENEDKVKKVKQENEDRVNKVKQENEDEVKKVKQDNEDNVKKCEVPSETVEETSTSSTKLNSVDIHPMGAIVNDVIEMVGPSTLPFKSPLKASKKNTENVTLAVTPKSSRRISPTPVPEKPIEEISNDSELEFKNRKGGKRKNKVDMESEDIIESSQESFADVTPLLNSSKRRKLSISAENVPVEENSKTQTTSVTPKATAEIPKAETVATVPAVVEVVEPQLELMESQDVEAAINTTQDTTISRESTLDSTQTQDSLQDISLSSKTDKTVSVDRQETLTQDTLTQITQETPSQIGLDVFSDMDKPTVLYLDLPKKPQLTESEQIMCRMDTMSICSNLEEFRSKSPTSHHQSMEEIELNARSPTKNQNEDDQLGTPNTNSIPSSPVTCHTPSKTTELLNSTFDISPITSETNSYSSDESSEVPVVKPLIFDSEKCKELADASENNHLTEVNNENDLDEFTREEDKDDSFHDEMSQEVARIKTNTNEDYDTNKNEDIGSEGDIITSDIHPGTNNLSNNYQNLDDEDDAVIDDVASSEEKTLTNTKTDTDFEEISETLLPRSLHSNFSKEASTIQDRSSKLRQIISRNSPIPNNSKFIKRRCLGAASPSAGRIKRLMHGLHTKPVVEKIEEVCEEDILTFTRDLPSPLAVPRNSILKRKFSDTSDSDSISPLAKRKRVNFSDPCLTSKKVFLKEEYQPSIEAKRLFDPNVDSNTGEENIQNIFYDILDNIAQTESENIETEPTLEIVNPHLLKKDKPIYPKLVDCTDDVMIILKKVMSPLFMNSLMNKLKSKKIKTIGDLSMMSETEINRLPFKVPVVANVYRTLDNYYKKKYGADEVNEQKQPSKNGVVDEKKDILVVKKDEVKAEVVVKKLDFKEQLEDLLKCAIRENVNLEELSKTVFSSLENGARHQVLKGILPKCDPEYVIDNTIEMCGTSKILDKLPNAQQEVEQFCSKKVALKDIVKNHTVDDLRLALSDLTDTNTIDKNDVIQNCFVPLLSKLSKDGHDQFLSNLSKMCLNGAEESLTVQLCKKDLLSTKELSSCLKSCLSAKEQDDQTEMMVELFRFSSRNLSVEMLMPLLAELFSSISNKSIKDKLSI